MLGDNDHNDTMAQQPITQYIILFSLYTVCYFYAFHSYNYVNVRIKYLIQHNGLNPINIFVDFKPIFELNFQLNYSHEIELNLEMTIFLSIRASFRWHNEILFKLIFSTLMITDNIIIRQFYIISLHWPNFKTRNK